MRMQADEFKKPFEIQQTTISNQALATRFNNRERLVFCEDMQQKRSDSVIKQSLLKLINPLRISQTVLRRCPVGCCHWF